MMQRLSRRDLPAIAAHLGAVAIIFGWLLRHLILLFQGFDYNAHRFYAEALAQGTIYYTHITYQLAVVGLATAVPTLEIVRSMWIVTIGIYIVTALILYLLLRGVTTNGWIAAGGALILLIANPITLLTAPAGNLYYGYIVFNAMHNPTTAMIRPFALIAVVFALRAFAGYMRFSGRTALMCVLVVGASLFVKPNFALVFIPALIVVVAYRAAVKQNYIGARLILLGIVAPTIVLLAVQYVLQFVVLPRPGGNSGIALMPFVATVMFEPSFWWIAIKLLLSLAFPLTVYLLYRRELKADVGIGLAWWMVAAGIAQMYLLTEGGLIARDLNFWAGAQIAGFILFAFTLKSWLPLIKREPRAWVSVALLALHVISGVLLYGTILTGTYAPR